MSTSGFIVVIDHEACTGHGVCYSTAPAVFAADAEGFGTVTAGVIPEVERPAIERIVLLCPEQAIRIEEIDSGADSGTT